jgi:uncharacterized protein
MPISRLLRAIGLCAVPFLFAVSALGLVTVHVSLQRKAERARVKAQQVAAPDRVQANPLIALRLPDLAAAAQKGDLSAKLEMGRRLAQGEGVRKNEGQAALVFQSVVDEVGEIGARDKRGPIVAAAFRYLSVFHRRGLPTAHIEANPAYAFGLMHHAASYFGDPAAQFELAQLLMSGDGVTKNSRAAAQWLLSATRKGYAPAQAMLGEMLWRGNGVLRAPGTGLGLLALARRNAPVADRTWVSKMFETARAEASPNEILEANAFIVQESGASHLVSGDSSEEVLVAPAQEATGGEISRQSSIIHGHSQPLARMNAGPVDLTATPFNMGLILQRNDPQASAGIIQMYRLWEQESRSDAPLTVKIAGVSQ